VIWLKLTVGNFDNEVTIFAPDSPLGTVGDKISCWYTQGKAFCATAAVGAIDIIATTAEAQFGQMTVNTIIDGVGVDDKVSGRTPCQIAAGMPSGKNKI
jgi:hypothetical protein